MNLHRTWNLQHHLLFVMSLIVNIPAPTDTIPLYLSFSSRENNYPPPRPATRLLPQ